MKVKKLNTDPTLLFSCNSYNVTIPAYFFDELLNSGQELVVEFVDPSLKVS